MKRIYKYQLNSDGTTTPPLSSHAIVKHVGYQLGKLQLWAEVDNDNPLRTGFKSHIKIVPTGGKVGDNYHHLATVHDPDGFHIWHVYEVEEDPR